MWHRCVVTARRKRASREIVRENTRYVFAAKINFPRGVCRRFSGFNGRFLETFQNFKNDDPENGPWLMDAFLTIANSTTTTASWMIARIEISLAIFRKFLTRRRNNSLSKSVSKVIHARHCCDNFFFSTCTTSIYFLKQFLKICFFSFLSVLQKHFYTNEIYNYVALY